MSEFAITLTLYVRADNHEEATGIAYGARDHLEETFNDDGSLFDAPHVGAVTNLTEENSL